MPERATTLGRLEEVVSTAEEFDRVVSQALTSFSWIRATGYTKRYSAGNRPVERRYRT